MITHRFLQKLILLFTSIMFIFGSLFVTSQTVQAKELTNVTFKTKLQNESRKEINPQELYVGAAYEFFVEFDLAAYDNNLADGDYFIFELPEPFDVKEKTEEFIFEEVAVADVEITSNGTDKGGQVKLTLKNLDQWMAKKNYTSVQGVKGNFSGKFKFNSESEVTIPLKGVDDTDTLTIKVLPAITRSEYDGITYNYRKMGGLTSKKDWTSEALGRSGHSVHSWNLRLNENGQTYHSFTVTDTLQTEGFQFIPESFKAYRVPQGHWTASGFDIRNSEELSQEEVAQLVEFNDSYTSFTANIGSLDGEGYYLTYDTTATNDGTVLTNGAQATEGGVPVKPFTNRADEVTSQSRESIVQGDITMKGRVDEVTIYKRDGITHRGLNGVTFEIADKATNQVLDSGTTFQNEVTGTNGYLRFSGLTVGHTYVIRETATLPGYDASKEPFEFTIEAGATEGLTKYWDNYRTPVSATITAQKYLENRDLVAEEFTFELVDEKGQVVSVAKNDADGLVTFEPQIFRKEGEFIYTIREKAGDNEEVTYDETKKIITVIVNGEDEGLVAKVEYEGNQPPTFMNIYNKPTPASLVLKAHKSLEGKDLVANQFSFTLTDKATNKVYSAQNAADGSVSFEELTFDQEGKFEFELAEVKGDLPGIAYDETKVAVTIEVTKEGNQLKAQVTTPNKPDENVAVYTFKNKYQAKSTTAQLLVTKVLTGRELKADEFSFTLTDESGKEIETVTNAGDGQVVFGELTFDKVGKYIYKVKEVKGTDSEITYDSKELTITITVTDNGQGQLVATVDYPAERQFVNEYVTTTTTESTTPSTTEPTVSTSGGVTTTNVTPKGGSSRRRVALPSTGEASGSLLIVLGTVVLATVGYGLKRHRR